MEIVPRSYHSNDSCSAGRRLSYRLASSSLVTLLLCMISSIGCGSHETATGRASSTAHVIEIQPTSFEVRASRRAFDGAPPTVPHQAFGIDCTVCHTQTGELIPTIGAAPANPHCGASQSAEFANCKQCHLFSQTSSIFVESSFTGRLQTRHASERANRLSPPVTPHSITMRRNCLACHAGPSARPEIRCMHPERTNCIQCHLTVDSEDRPTGVSTNLP
jgi:hypothetical protein